MIYSVTGNVAVTEQSFVVIEAGGIGYKINVSGNTLGKVAAKKNDGAVRLLTYMSVREDAIELFGFYDSEELTAFKLLISVSGVGPKGALSILSQLSPERFALAIATSDTKALSAAQGIGKRIAERIILELKDKIAKEISVNDVNSSDSGFTPAENGDKSADAVNTLIVLGYTRSEALNAIRGININALTIEDIIKEALKKLMKQ